LNTVGGSVWSELKGNDSEKPLPLTDEGRVPDFFDHWMEEYISKVAADQPGTGRRQSTHDQAETDGNDTAETAHK